MGHDDQWRSWQREPKSQLAERGGLSCSFGNGYRVTSYGSVRDHRGPFFSLQEDDDLLYADGSSFWRDDYSGCHLVGDLDRARCRMETEGCRPKDCPRRSVFTRDRLYPHVSAGRRSLLKPIGAFREQSRLFCFLDAIHTLNLLNEASLPLIRRLCGWAASPASRSRPSACLESP